MEKKNILPTSNTEMVTISRAEYEKLLSRSEELDEISVLYNWLQEQLKIVKKNTFGSKSEHACEEVDGQMRILFNEPEAYAFMQQIEERNIDVKGYTKRPKVEKTVLMDKLPEGIPVETEEHRLTDEERKCPECGKLMDEIGKETVRTLKIIPAQVVVHEDVYYTYKCSSCLNDNGSEIIEKTPHNAACYPGSYAAPESVAYLMTEKFVMGSPLYRMEQDFERKRIPLSRQTMSNWMIYCAQRWLKPIYEELKIQLLKEDILHADETELQVLREPGKTATSKSYMWLFRTGKYAAHPIVIYDYADTRSGDVPVEFLKNFAGKYLQTDGYSGYNGVDCTHVGCLAHIKRKFHEAVEVLPKGKKSGTAVEGEAYCKKLFEIEEMLANMSPDERYTERLRVAKPVLDEFLSWAKTRSASKKTKLGAALTYLNNQGPKLSNYLDDGRLEISNNLAERSIKPFVMSRKNFLFANTPKGADCSAVMFSIIETAKENGLDPYKYLTYLFKNAPQVEANGNGAWVNLLLPTNVSAEQIEAI